MKSYIKLNLREPKSACEKIRTALQTQDSKINAVRNNVKILNSFSNRSRKLLAADSGFNNAYDTPFTVFKSAVVDEEINVDSMNNIYLFHVDNYNTDRLKRLLMQITLYEAIAKIVKSNPTNSLLLVDGTITLSVFNPTQKDSKEYRKHFKKFLEETYFPLLQESIEKDIILLGFLKRTGSTFLAQNLGINDVYDIHIMNALLKNNGEYLSSISIASHYFSNKFPTQNYVTFYLNLKGWNYRFELVEQQKGKYVECIENLLSWATATHYGMNPIFSKADEYSRVTKRDANLLFNHILAGLPDEEQTKIRLQAKKKTHFGYGSSSFIRTITK